MKKLIAAVLVLAVLGGVAALLLLGNLDAIVRDAIQTVGSRATRASVTVDTVALRPTKGTGSITGLTVGNPEGFESERAFAFGEISIELDPREVARTPTRVKRVSIDRCDVVYEWRLGGSNMSQLQENVGAYVAGDRTIEAAKTGRESARVVIDELVVEGGTIEVSASGLRGRSVRIPLDRIVLRDVGAKEGGATAAELTAELVRVLTRRVIEAVAASGIDGVRDIRRVGEKILDGARDLLDER